jgi:ribosomal protein L11 methyltransferase
MKSESKNNWFALEIRANSAVSEAVEFALNELDALGTEINNLGKVTPETLEIVGYFNKKISEENVRETLKFALNIYSFSTDSVKNFAWHEVENQDWLAEWKKHWKPTESTKFIIAPTWEKLSENEEKIVIRIEPSMAFGTGTHETTRLCLQAIEENYKAGESFFDVGTGTGILAVCAAKIQGKKKKEKGKILACDTDQDSIKIAKENAELNNTKEIEFYVGSIDEKTPKFDFVCANVTLDVIVPMLPLLLEKSIRVLVLSGILKEQEDKIREELQKFGIENPQIETLGEWISVVVNQA